MTAGAVKKCPLFYRYRRRTNDTCDAGRATEHNLLARVDVTFDSAIYLRDRHIDHGLGNLSASAYDERAVGGVDVTGKTPINTQHRFKANLTGEVQHVAYETQPIVLWSRRAWAFFNGCWLTTHRLVLSVPLTDCDCDDDPV